jgi:hypothetical protein
MELYVESQVEAKLSGLHQMYCCLVDLELP